MSVISKGRIVHDCQWGECSGVATEIVEYPDGHEVPCCAECAVVAREEAAHLESDQVQDGDED